MEKGRSGESLETSTWDAELTDHYTIMSSLGHGSFAQVQLARHLLTNELVAVKILRLDEIDDGSIIHEITMMKTLHHPYIIQMFHVINSAKHVYIVMELGDGGDLGRIILKAGWLREEQAQNIFPQVLSAIDYCHDKGIAHRDIKPENIVEAGEGHYKLCDFGLATQITKGKKLKKACGSYLYCAPEVLKGRPYDGFAADMWSLGIVLYVMVVGCLPYDESTRSMQEFMIVASDFSIPSHLSMGITHIIAHLLCVSPKVRPTAGQLLGHPWVKRVKDNSKICVRDIFPSMPNPKILGAMCHLGFKPHDLIHCLQEKVYNEVLATYLIMNHQSIWRDSDEQVRQAELEAPVMTPRGFPSFTPPLRRTQSMPAFSTLARPTTAHRRAKKFRKSWDRADSTPPILWCPPEPSPPHEPASASPMTSSFEGSQCSRTFKLTSSSSTFSHITDIQEEEWGWANHSVTPQPTQGEPTTSTSNSNRICQVVMRRIVKMLQNLCFCFQAYSRARASRRTAATQGGDCTVPEENGGEVPGISSHTEEISPPSMQTGKMQSEAGTVQDSGLPCLAQMPPSSARGSLSAENSSGQEIWPSAYHPCHSALSRELTRKDAQSGLPMRSPSAPLLEETSRASAGSDPTSLLLHPHHPVSGPEVSHMRKTSLPRGNV